MESNMMEERFGPFESDRPTERKQVWVGASLAQPADQISDPRDRTPSDHVCARRAGRAQMCTPGPSSPPDGVMCAAPPQTTLGETLGKESGDIGSTSFEMSLRQGAQATMASDMHSCMQTATTLAARKACSDAARQNMAKAPTPTWTTVTLTSPGPQMMGKSTMTKQDFKVAQKQAAAENLHRNMVACMEAAGTNRTLVMACRSSNAKKALAASLGKSTSEANNPPTRQPPPHDPRTCRPGT